MMLALPLTRHSSVDYFFGGTREKFCKMADKLKIYTKYQSCLLWVLVLTSSIKCGRTHLKIFKKIEKICMLDFKQ